MGAAYGAIFQCLAVRVFDAIVAGRSSAPVTHVRCNQGATFHRGTLLNIMRVSGLLVFLLTPFSRYSPARH